MPSLDVALILEVEWFDRIGNLGRRAVCSLAALDAEFVGIEPAAGRSFRGGLPDSLPEANLHASVVNQTWQRAETSPAPSSPGSRRQPDSASVSKRASPHLNDISRRLEAGLGGWGEYLERCDLLAPRQSNAIPAFAAILEARAEKSL